MKVKTYATQRGAEGFAKRLRARWPGRIFQVACGVSLDFRDNWFVEVLQEDATGARWIGVGSMSKPS